LQAEKKELIGEIQDLGIKLQSANSKSEKYYGRIVYMATAAEQEAGECREKDRMTQIYRVDSEQKLAAMTLRFEEAQKNLTKSHLDISHLKDRFSDIEEQLQDMTIKNEMAVKELELRGEAPDPNHVALEAMLLEDARMRSEETLVSLEECTEQLAAEVVKSSALERDQDASNQVLAEKTCENQQLQNEKHVIEEALLLTHVI
jgi:hypothetical protein